MTHSSRPPPSLFSHANTWDEPFVTEEALRGTLADSGVVAADTVRPMSVEAGPDSSRSTLPPKSGVAYQSWFPERDYEVLDTDAVDDLARHVVGWADAHCLMDPFRRVGKHIVIHVSRLMVSLKPWLELEVREVIAELATWLTIAETDPDESRLRQFLASGQDARSPIEHAAIDVRRRLLAQGLDFAGFSRALLIESASDGAVVVERAYHWVRFVLEKLSRGPLSAIRNIPIEVPESWLRDLNPHSLEVGASVGAWLRDLSIVRGDVGERVFQDLMIAEFVGWPFADAGRDELWIIMAFLSLWILHDDDLEGVGTPSPELMARAVSGRILRDDPALANPFIRGYAEIGRRLGTVMSEEWISRHHDQFLDWTRSVRDEAAIIRQFRDSDFLPSFKEYIELRRRTSGVLTMMNFIEVTVKAELPSHVYESDDVQEAIALVVDIVAIHNDLFGFSKDMKQRMPSLATTYEPGEADGDCCALSILAKIHNQHIASLKERMAELADGPAGELPVVTKWLAAIRHVVAGFVDWHAVTLRYSDVHVLPTGEIARFVIRPYDAGAVVADGHPVLDDQQPYLHTSPPVSTVMPRQRSCQAEKSA